MNPTTPRATCPNCGSKQVIYRKRLPNYWCRRCPWIGNKPNYEVTVTCESKLTNEVTQQQGIVHTEGKKK